MGDRDEKGWSEEKAELGSPSWKLLRKASCRLGHAGRGMWPGGEHLIYFGFIFIFWS